MSILNQLGWKRRLQFAFTHLIVSATVVCLIALWMFLVWYPEPFRSLSGGLHLFGILTMVDLMLGPCATLVISSPNKLRREWNMDVGLVILFQLGALGYGVWTVYQARPVYLAFEIDRFRTIHAIDVPADMLMLAPEGFQSLPKSGPGLIAVRPFKNENERTDATLAALQGIHLGARPDLWATYSSALNEVRKESKPIEELLSSRPSQAALIQSAIDQTGFATADLMYLPLAGRDHFWTVLIHARTGKPLSYLPIDPY